MFALVVRFEVRDSAAADEFDRLTALAVEEITAHEPGARIYATHVVDGEPLVRVFYELYADDDAFAAHEQAEHVRRFHAEKDPLLVGPPRVEFLRPGPVKGLPS